MPRLLLISVTLFAFWLLLSGNYQLWLIAAGAATAYLVVRYVGQIGIVDTEGFPVERLRAGFSYWPWLVVEIAKSAVNVSKIILNPALPISPRMVAVTSLTHSSVGLVTYANSITLTPGTIAVEVGERSNTIWVHAITAENAAGFADDEMNRRVAAFDGAPDGDAAGDAAGDGPGDEGGDTTRAEGSA